MQAVVPSSNDIMSEALERAGGELDHLLGLLDHEFDTLKRRDIDAFEGVQQEKTQLLTSLADVAAWARGQNPIPAKWQALQEPLERARDLHMRNLQLMQRQLDAVRGALQTLQGDAAPSIDLYDRMGHVAQRAYSLSSYQLA